MKSHFRSPGFYPLPCWQGIVQHPFQPTWVQEIEEESICHLAPSHLEQFQDGAAEVDAEEEGWAGGSGPSREQRPSCPGGEWPLFPAGGEEASGQAKWRSSLTFWRKIKTPAPLAGHEAHSGPKWRWPRVMLCRRDPGEGGSRARWLCGFLSREQRSQEPSPWAQQKPSTSLATEEPPARPEQELGSSGTGTSSSAYSRGASSYSVGSDSPEAEVSLFAEPRSAQQKWAEEEEEEWVEEEEEEEEKEEEDVSPEQDTIRVTQEHLQGRAELVKDRAQQLLFLHAVPRLCFLAQQQGWTFWSPTSPKQPLWRALQ
ncbi:uncharacterized protein LOC116839346 isoform X2 [Chelonoidis abingdonii]|uniref:uncharacterized protein LOC116839346 isoform X2 n=1 Tax=Chelonoidis abingdonii TaxID=106734 RepID=UPI003F494C35